MRSDSGAESVMSSEVNRTTERGGVLYSRDLGSCEDFVGGQRILQNSPLSKMTSPGKINFSDLEEENGRKSE